MSHETEKRSIQIFTAHGDEPFHERMRKRNIRDCLDFVDLEDPEIDITDSAAACSTRPGHPG
jgi:hypothetical protein